MEDTLARSRWGAGGVPWPGPDEVPPARDRVFPGIGQHMEYLICGGRYASRVQAGEHSCCSIFDIVVQFCCAPTSIILTQIKQLTALAEIVGQISCPPHLSCNLRNLGLTTGQQLNPDKFNFSKCYR